MDSDASSGLDRVREVMGQAIDVDLPDDLARDRAGPRGTGQGGPDQPSGSDSDGVDDGDMDRGAPPPDMGEGEDLPPEAACVNFPLNDLGNGQRLIHHFGPDLIWISRVGWFVWEGKRWQADPDGIAVRRMAHNLSDLIAKESWYLPMRREDQVVLADAEIAEAELAELGVLPKDERSPDVIAQEAALARTVAAARKIKEAHDKAIGRRLTHAKNAGNSNAIQNLIKEAGTIIARPLEDMDTSPLVINTEGGVLEVVLEPGEDDGGTRPAPPKVRIAVQPHARDQMLTKIMPVGLDPAAKCPLFTAFLERVQPDSVMRKFLQRWFAVSMTGLKVQQFAFFYGAGANGKSVLVDLMARIMGDYAASAKIESITGKNRRGGGDATPDLIPLIGARFVRTSEPDEGERLREGLIKELTGGEPILVRALNENFVLIYPIFKLTITGNHKPEIHGGDDGIWRRVLLVPFDVQIPEEERDVKIVDKLFAERDGIMNWLIEGLRDYLTNGLQVPDQVRDATLEYREDSDPVGTFLTKCCEVTGDAADKILAKRLGEAFNWWMDDGGRGQWTANTVSKRLKAKAERYRSPVNGKTFTSHKASVMHFQGIRFTADFAQRFDKLHRDQNGNIIAGQTSDLEGFQ